MNYGKTYGTTDSKQGYNGGTRMSYGRKKSLFSMVKYPEGELMTGPSKWANKCLICESKVEVECAQPSGGN